MKVATRKRRLPKGAVIDVLRAKLVSGYRVNIHFSDGKSSTVDFRRFLESSTNPLIRAFLDPKRFGLFEVRDGDLMWGDYELCFPVADLYEGRI
jgi:hypothetical protein